MTKFLTTFFAVLLSGTAAGAQSLAPAFYVAPGGSDNNPGDLDRPFAKIEKCLSAMRASSDKKTCYIRAGTYAYKTNTASCYGNPFAIKVTDNGITLSYYPPDGYGSAKITGAGGTADGGICLAGSGITVDGLDIGHYSRFAISSENTDNTIINNTLHDTTRVASNGTLFMNGNIQRNKARHNYVYNSSNNGIVAQPNNPGNIVGVEITNNFVSDSATNCSDCGGIYSQFANSAGARPLIAYNYVGDLATNESSPGSKSIYLDDMADTFDVVGNVVRPGAKGWACFHVHGGQNNNITGNICDQNGASAPGGIVFYQTSGSGSGLQMGGNVFANNLILTATNNAGGGYRLDGSAKTKLAVSNNNYWGYGGTKPSHTGSGAAGGGDTNPASVDPGITCGWTYAQSSGQPAGWGTPGFWGPPGFVVPERGTAPSSPAAPCGSGAPPPASLSCTFTVPGASVAAAAGATVPLPPLSMSCQ